MSTFAILCKEGKLSDIINEIENIPKDLNNFTNFFKNLCICENNGEIYKIAKNNNLYR